MRHSGGVVSPMAFAPGCGLLSGGSAGIPAPVGVLEQGPCQGRWLFRRDVAPVMRGVGIGACSLGSAPFEALLPVRHLAGRLIPRPTE